jgi:hypothetical protein
MYQYIAISSQLPALSELDTLGKAANPGVNSVTLSLELLALRREGEVDCDVYHS